MTVDAELRDLATTAAYRYTDSFLTAQGWTRQELVDAIHARLRTKYVESRANGALVATPDGRIVAADTCPTPLKQRYRSKSDAKSGRQRARAVHGNDRLWPYECPAGGHWHLTHWDPDMQKWIAARIAAASAAPQATTTYAPPPTDVS